MTEPCTIEQLETAAATLRDLAVASGKRLELAKVNGAKMRQIWVLEDDHHAAWLRYYDVDNRLHQALHARAS